MKSKDVKRKIDEIMQEVESKGITFELQPEIQNKLLEIAELVGQCEHDEIDEKGYCVGCSKFIGVK